MAWIALWALGCTASHDVASYDAGAPDAYVPPPPPTDAVDLLFVIENAGGVGEEQASLSAALPAFLRALTTGDVDGDGAAENDPISSLQIGVVTTDMGTGGFVVPTCARGDFGDDGILRTQGNTADPACEADYPPVLVVEDAEPDARRLACVAMAGVGGCGFEQQLEAMLKALSPSAPTSWTAPGYATPRFFRDTLGHGGGGLVRSGSVVAIVVVAEEDDCSASDPSIFDPQSEQYAGDLNLRCHRHADQAVHPIARYVEGLLQLRAHPSRV
ncbi:MAG: hypothetical protein K8H88_30090, partial [Sandaracinaceae bacterium]|nr:hypothetical protein [Sandaracinaceae bacterium]